jgi:hypothetical protein
LHNDLDLFSAYIIQPALAILGGGTGERKFLGIDKKNGDFCRRAWGAACDAWLYFIPHYKSTERPTILKQDLVFVTNDSALFEIYRKINAKYVIHTGGKRQYENEFDLDYPNFREQIGIVGALFDAYDRTDRRLKAPKTNYKPIIEELTNKLE